MKATYSYTIVLNEKGQSYFANCLSLVVLLVVYK